MSDPLENNIAVGELDGRAREDFNVIILYDQVAAVRRAMGSVGHLVTDFLGDLDIRLDLWRFDVLGLPGLARVATLNAANAEMLIVVMQADGDLPPVVRDWVKFWSSQNVPGNAALVLLRHSRPRPEDGTGAGEAFLAAVAREGGHDFFAYEMQGVRRTSEPQPMSDMESLPGTDNLIPGLPEHFHPESHWGINE